jgi:DNA topoisomerase-3
MRLFIAEKPSVAKSLAEELGVTGKGEGFIQCGEDSITWCFGHMLELAEPDEYTSDEVPKNPINGKKFWRIEELPIIPQTWIIQPKKEAQKQLKIMGRLLKEATSIVNAGDCDREGQLLVDEVLEYFNNTLPVVRFWVSAHDSVSLQRGLSSMKDNALYQGFGRAAMGRGRADWLIGMNLSRAYTLRAQRGGSRALLTVGRVQTPTLALVVGRDRDIDSFKPAPYHTIKAAFQQKNNAFIATWRAGVDGPGMDSEGRLVDTAVANALVDAVSGKPGQISIYKQEPKKINHPRAYSLSDITLLASNKWGYSAMEVLDACQSLYETHKLTSYPRTDCAFLPESQHQDAPQILEALRVVNPDLSSLIDGADTQIKSTTWDDTKVSAHYGIIPTMHKGSRVALSDKERALYDLIVRAYIAQFYPLHQYLSTKVGIDVAGVAFEAHGKTVTHNGWREVYLEEDEECDINEAEHQKLPPMTLHDEVMCLKATRQDSKTKPPSRFTEGTLQRAMENIHKFISDSEHKKMLRDGDGIGTSATRAAIISELKRRNFLEAKGKLIISTTLGRSVIDALPEVVKSPVLTALYERALSEIEKNPAACESFIQQQAQCVIELVAKANDGMVKIAGAKEVARVSERYSCTRCNKGLCRRPGKKGFWWSCSGYPDCKQAYPDVKGKPNYTHAQTD